MGRGFHLHPGASVLRRSRTEVGPIEPVTGARRSAKLGDLVTTDHISPAGTISPTTPAGQFLIAEGVQPAMFNSYGRGAATTGS